MTATAEQPLADAASRIAFMRAHMRPYWFGSEAGGMYLGTGGDDDLNAKIYTDFLRRVPETSVTEVMRERWSILQTLIIDDLAVFFTTATLQPGRYELDNYHLAQAKDGKIQFSTHGDEPTELPREDRFSFEVTAEQLRLIPRMNIRMWENVIEIMDAKRPYGDMTYYPIDMADALGEGPLPRDGSDNVVLTPQQEKRFVDLHRSMLFAVQAFWTYAR
jgi:hypothetical protein